MRPNLSIFEVGIVWYDKVAYLHRNKKMSEEYPFEIENKAFESYFTYLYEPSRTPSKGGNTSALHLHYMIVDGKEYSFFARGTKKFAYKGELVSFRFTKKKTGEKEYNNVDMQSIFSIDKNGMKHIRGDRTYKKVLRTATQRAPVSRREWRD